MGLLSSVGIGIGAAANAAQPFILNMQQAEIQKLRDDRMAEIAKGAADYAFKLSLDNEQTIYDRKLAREPEETSREIAKKGLLAASEANLEDQRRNDPVYLKGVAAEAAAKRDPLDAEVKRAALKESKEGKVSFQPVGDGRIAKVDKSGNVIGFMTDPETGKPILGKTDLSESALKLAAVYADAAKAADLAGNTEEAKAYRKDATDLLTKKQAGGIDDLFPAKVPAKVAPAASSSPTTTAPAVSTQKAPTLPANPTQADIQKFDNYFGYGKAKELLNARGNK